MSDMVTQPMQTDVQTFLDGVKHPGRREDALVLLDLFRDVTGFEPVMWGPSIVGFGRYHYVYESGRSGDMCATGFSPRKANMSLYIMPGYQDFGPILERLGPHKTGKACLYLGRLSKVDLDVLKELVKVGLDTLDTIWPVNPT